MKNILLLLVAFMAFTLAPGRALASVSDAGAPAVQALEAEPLVKVTQGGFEVHNPDAQPVSVEVYALTGQRVMAEHAPSGVTSFSLPAGYYIVRIGNHKTTKIVVK